jgi:guanine nucleotide-binding protein G(i) subunit alpha
MGACTSSEEQEQRRQNDVIEQQLKQDRLRMRNEVKLLLLGMWLGR